MKNRLGITMLSFLAVLSLMMITWTTHADAVESILADTAGIDSFTGPNYYGVRYLEGASFIQSVTFDISADPNGFFDFDGSDSFQISPGVFATAPVLGTLTGLVPADIAFAFSNFDSGVPTHPKVLTANFAPGAFEPGDSFRFAADTDFYRQDPTPGGVFGLPGSERAIFSVLLESGQSGSAPFIEIFDTSSVAVLAFCPLPVPLPPSLILFGSGLLGVVGLRLSRKPADIFKYL